MKTLISKIYLILILLFAYAFYPNFFFKVYLPIFKKLFEEIPYNVFNNHAKYHFWHLLAVGARAF